MKHHSASTLIAAAALCVGLFCRGEPTSPSIISPDGTVRFKLFAEDKKSLLFSVTFRDKAVIEKSPLRFTLDGIGITSDFQLGETKQYQINETYPWRGVHSRATNRCNGATISLKHAQSGTSYTLEVRAFNNGAAFRYVVPGNDTRVPDENDAFQLPAGCAVWYHKENGHYEDVYQNKNIAEVPVGDWAMPPVTFKLPRNAGYASITEAALVNFSGMALQADGHSGFNLVLAHKQPASYPYRLRYSTNDVERLSHPSSIAGTITTPWRVVMVGSDLNALVNCDIVHNLCPPPDSKLFPGGINTGWLKPGRAVWKYMDGGDSTLEGTKEFCRLAGQLGFEYNVVEGYWSRWSDDEIKDLVNDARRHGVGLWFWKHSRRLRTPEEREEFFKKLHDLGIVGAKIDFFDHEHKEVIDLYQALLRDAARHRILVNFHGSNKPTGEARTWPNEMVREAVRGMEASKLADRATHDSILPFTRYLAGHADYTVMHFGERRSNTTWAHQIATAAVFTAPLLTYVANPTNILKNPAVEMIKSIPPTWDETIVLPSSEIGEFAAFARRSDDRWFLALINGTKARSVKIPLSFLGAGKYEAMLVRDDKENSAAVAIQNTTAKRTDSVKIDLREGGGFIGRFSKN